MVVNKIIFRTLFLTFIGISIVTFLCINELLYGSGLTHPIWDKTFNWLVLFRNIVLISFVGGLLSGAASSNGVQRSHLKKTAIKGGYQYGH